MMTENALKAERLTHMDGLTAALALAGLPVADLDRSARVFFRFTDKDETIGYGGLEGSAPDMLLRSIAVAPDARNRGHGGRIVAALEHEAVALGVVRLHLLTNTAERFFGQRGYAPADRKDAPPPIASCEQFRSLCPASAVYLVKRVAP